MVYILKILSAVRRLFSRTRSIHEIALSGIVNPSGVLVAQLIPKKGDREATRVADSQGRSVASDLNPDGSIRYSIQGSSPTGETDSLNPCRILVERLNNDGASWEYPKVYEGQEDGIDCEAQESAQRLYMQVTRIAPEESWRELGNTRNVIRDTVFEKAVEELHEAVRRKQLLDRKQREKITLVLDATDTSHHSYKEVVHRFRQRYGEEVRNEFKAIWVVGPTAAMTARLDMHP